jgi:hypothetical protein
VVPENPGHKDAATAPRIYAHVIKEEAKVMDSVLFRA